MNRCRFFLYRKFMYDMSIANKIIVFTIVITLIPLLCMSLLYYYKMEQVVENELSSSYQQEVSQYIDNINYKFDIYQTFADNIALNRTIEELFSKQDKITIDQTIETSNLIKKEINSLILLKDIQELDSIMLYANNDKFPSDGIHIRSISLVDGHDWYRKISLEDMKKPFFYITPGRKKKIISFTAPINNFTSAILKQQMGFVKIDIDAESFFRIDSEYWNEKNKDIFIMDNNGEFIFGSNKEKLIKFKQEDDLNIIASNFGVVFTNISGKKEVVIHKPISKQGWSVVFLYYYDEMKEKLDEIMNLIILSAISLFIIIITLVLAFSRVFSNRIKELVKKMEMVKRGSLEIDTHIPGKDEIGILEHNFYDMIEKVKELIMKNYVQQLEKREAELNALQFQINPHFLYNTLESINAIATVYDCEEICDICEGLGDMFRYSINRGKSEFVLLYKELEHIDNYIQIQKIRFKNCFDVFYNVDEKIKSCKTLKFILQPIVENSIVHGFYNKKEKGYLEICAYIKDYCLFIKVLDDGCGMSEEQLKNLTDYVNGREEKLLKNYKKSIGVKNVNDRIKLTYGNQYGIEIKSKTGAGTQVIIKLPVYGYQEG